MIRRIVNYTWIAEYPALAKADPKVERLKRQGALNRHPDRVRAPWFLGERFFDARDLVQVKYEMLRHARLEGGNKSEAAALFGVSRPTFYQTEAAFSKDGLGGLLPRPRGPKSPHKLTLEVMAFIEAQLAATPPPGARALSRQIKAELGLAVHPRSIERALARKKKLQTHASP
jgi:transposase